MAAIQLPSTELNMYAAMAAAEECGGTISEVPGWIRVEAHPVLVVHRRVVDRAVAGGLSLAEWRRWPGYADGVVATADDEVLEVHDEPQAPAKDEVWP